MTEECVTPLRRRMIEDMSVRHFASKTQHDYIRTVMKLTRFLGRSPDTATNEDLRRFQLHLTENRAGAPIITKTASRDPAAVRAPHPDIWRLWLPPMPSPGS